MLKLILENLLLFLMNIIHLVTGEMFQQVFRRVQYLDHYLSISLLIIHFYFWINLVWEIMLMTVLFMHVTET